MTEILAVALVVAKPGLLGELRGALEVMLSESESESGLLWWTLSRPSAEDDALMVTELFADEQAYDHHETRAEITEASVAMAPLISSVESHTGALIARAESHSTQRIVSNEV